jgi:hypothetical protein
VSKNLVGFFLLAMLVVASLVVVLLLIHLLLALVLHFPIIQRFFNFFFPSWYLASLFHKILH